MIKKLTLLILFTFLSFHSYSQIVFEKAYYIDNNNTKVNCLIRNQDWIKTPKEFQYKLTETEQPQTLTIQQVKEFGFENDTKYQRYTVNIDKSSEIMRNMSYVKNPEFNEETLFLKVLVEGKASLYQYDENDLKRFFFKTDDVAITQLVYKSYKITELEIGHNNHYKQQLANALKDNSISEKNIKNLTYSKDKLVEFFSKYNHLVDPKVATTEIKVKKDLFNLNVRAGVSNSSVSLQHKNMPLYDADFGNKTQLRFGVETEFILGFNKNKWAFIIEPTYQFYEEEKTIRNHNMAINYKSIELPFGIRYYSFLNTNSKLFFNFQYIVDFQLGSEIKYPPFGDFDISTRNSFAFGIGYKFKDKYSLEFRYVTKKILQHTSINADFTSTSLVLGYTIF
ncbi:outer membrane beta-barrel protein [Flavobacterium quisquiliarum]|uniref:Outer membrane beta-barrel protein n=1 Tax=Flavobacterium quisquiliarum TaxID=1834436 RepID=A0ABV8W7L9_9FLAO|nr:outer membrane beta-barrel protein [Flavobacterium quisquiliarum]MBW1654221.1 outer membrane beta-barrel protein [Flavobacterium quisquiliarum]NWL00786.1 tRNA modification GTPase [Flavobacterium collinsii]